ncbi:hypothetical protein AK812_SmicGene6623 [Symbiodinium microadriaticum]|uniref:Uncharacterized protein n=1 Tax=Symbiodinium microadriaticum TaxID=2951 RepID=A0A1Q9EQW0_SYMMI|nr:hypothetical protein AK812_SmicGene6623 [Symbiodinium microadriaticum]
MVGDPKKAFDLVTSVSTVRGLAVHWHQWRVSPVWRVMIYNQHFLAWLPEVTFLPKPKSDAQRQRYARLCGHQMFSRIEHEECTLPHSSGILKIFQLLHVALRPEQSLGLGAILSKQCVLQRVLACLNGCTARGLRQASLLRILCIGDDLAEQTKQFMMRYQRSDDKDLEALKANSRVVGSVIHSSSIALSSWELRSAYEWTADNTFPRSVTNEGCVKHEGHRWIFSKGNSSSSGVCKAKQDSASFEKCKAKYAACDPEALRELSCIPDMCLAPLGKASPVRPQFQIWRSADVLHAVFLGMIPYLIFKELSAAKFAF